MEQNRERSKFFRIKEIDGDLGLYERERLKD